MPEELLRRLETIPAREEGSPVLTLPGPNPFIPSEFGLRADDHDNAAVGSAEGGAGVGDDVRSLLPATIPPIALETVPREDWSRLIPPSRLPSYPTAAAAAAAAGCGGGGVGDAAGVGVGAEVGAGVGVGAGAGVRQHEAEGEGQEAVIVWHKMDRSYRVPRSAIVAKLWTPEPYGSPEGAALSRMFVRLLREDLKSWAYDAALADLRYSLEMTTHGLQLSVGGFSSKVSGWVGGVGAWEFVCVVSVFRKRGRGVGVGGILRGAQL